MAKVGLIFGGHSVEHLVSVRSARTVAKALGEAGHTVIPLAVDEKGCFVARPLAERALRGEVDAIATSGSSSALQSLHHLTSTAVDVMFPLIHGTTGEDGALQGLCEFLDLPYVGTGIGASAVGMDKVLAKSLWRDAGLPIVEFAVLTQRDVDNSLLLDDVEKRLGKELFVKPAVGGSSVGCGLVFDRATLVEGVKQATRFCDRALVEKRMRGREIECAILGTGTLIASALGEIVPGAEFYDYADKYLNDAAGLLVPAPVSDLARGRLRQTAIDAFAAIGGSGMARVDFFFVDDDRFFLNEVNTVPGFTSISMYPRLFGESGVSLPALVDRLVAQAVEVHARKRNEQRETERYIASLASKR